MKKVVFLAVLVLCAAFVFVGCTNNAGGGTVLIFDETSNDPALIKDGSTVAPNSLVKFAWTDASGNAVNCNFVLTRDGVVVKELNGVTEVTTSVPEEGHYTATITPVGARVAKELNFTVNKMYEELYKLDSGRYLWRDYSSIMLAAMEDGGDVELMYRKLKKVVVDNENPEETNEGVRVSLLDENEDGVYDAWKEVATTAEQEGLVAGYVLTNYGTAVYKTLQYTDESIALLDVVLVDALNPAHNGLTLGFNTPITLATVGISLNTLFTTVIYDDGAYVTHGEKLYISERYDSDKKPVFSVLEETNASAGRDADITIDVVAENVAGFATLYDTKYMQAAVSYPASLTLASVEFENFVAGSKEFTSYKVLEKDYDGQKIVMLYRALVAGADEEGTVTPFFAKLNFNTPEENGNGNVLMATDGGYLYGYGPMFKNDANGNVDGFIFDYEPITVQW